MLPTFRWRPPGHHRRQRLQSLQHSAVHLDDLLGDTRPGKPFRLVQTSGPHCSPPGFVAQKIDNRVGPCRWIILVDHDRLVSSPDQLAKAGDVRYQEWSPA